MWEGMKVCIGMVVVPRAGQVRARALLQHPLAIALINYCYVLMKMKLVTSN